MPDHSMNIRKAVLAALALAVVLPAAAEDGAIPHSSKRMREGYREYREAEMHRAFAIAPGGAWSWKSGFDTTDEAVAEAITACQKNTDYPCVSYAINDKVVLDGKLWPTLWRPYPTAQQAAQAREGRQRGERFPDLLLTGPDAKPQALSGLHGKVVLLHFWGTWCPTCVHELPQLEKLANALRDTPDVAFVFTQMREPYGEARGWLQRQGLKIPLYDSGSHRQQDSQLRVQGGGVLADRAVALVYPTTYVLDRNGIVLFSLRGSADDWSQYAAFLRDVVAQTK
jgi:thiol-disulfide isomerase/thioredoxin